MGDSMGVSLRKKKLASGKTSLYLDIYFNGRRDYEFLNLYLTKDKNQNKESQHLIDATECVFNKNF